MTANFTGINKVCPDIKYINRTYEFSFSCSPKFPYEINETHRCIESCDNETLLKGICRKNNTEYFFNGLNEDIDECLSDSPSNTINNENFSEYFIRHENFDILLKILILLQMMKMREIFLIILLM